jgi:hypothetical protein
MLVNVADEDIKFPFLHILASVLAWASAVINPFIYAFKNRQYQQAFAKVSKTNTLGKFDTQTLDVVDQKHYTMKGLVKKTITL